MKLINYRRAELISKINECVEFLIEHRNEIMSSDDSYYPFNTRLLLQAHVPDIVEASNNYNQFVALLRATTTATQQTP